MPNKQKFKAIIVNFSQKYSLFSKQTIRYFAPLFIYNVIFLNVALIASSLLWKIGLHFQWKATLWNTPHQNSKLEIQMSERSRELTLNIFHKGDYSLRQHLFLCAHLCLSRKNIRNFRCGCNDEISRRDEREHLWHSSISPEHKTNSLNLRKSILSSLTRFDSLGKNC